MGQDAALQEGVELVLHELRQAGPGGGFGLGEEGRGVLLDKAVQRGLLGAVTFVVDRGAVARPVGLLRRGLHAVLPRLCPRTVSSRAQRRNRPEGRLPLGAYFRVPIICNKNAAMLKPAGRPAGLVAGAKERGAALGIASPRGSTALALRQRCAWGQPGRSPYQGTVEQALGTARLPADILQKIASKVRARHTTDRLVISNATIRTEASQRQFDPRSVVMTYGQTLCLATRVNFKPSHEERADLYQVADRNGQRGGGQLGMTARYGDVGNDRIGVGRPAHDDRALGPDHDFLGVADALEPPGHWGAFGAPTR